VIGWANTSDDAGQPAVQDQLILLSQTSPRRFGPPTLHEVGYGPRWIEVGDMNGDAWPDLVVVDEHSYPTDPAPKQEHAISVALGDPSNPGGLQPSFNPVYVEFAPRALSLLDLDGDHDLDALTIRFDQNKDNDALVALTNDGTGRLTVEPAMQPPPLPAEAATCEPVAQRTADLDGDGNLEVVLAGNGCLVVLIYAPARRAWTTVDVPGVGLLGRFELGDLDQDGHMEMVAPSGGELLIFQGADASFLPPNRLELAGAQASVIADLDDDGDLDLAIAAGTERFITSRLWYAANRADADQDGFNYGVDCNDGNAFVFPGATEEPNGVDDDCDGTVDEGTNRVDDDGDGVLDPVDCDDTRRDVFPGASEQVDDRDNDCDGEVDEVLAGPCAVGPAAGAWAIGLALLTTRWRRLRGGLAALVLVAMTSPTAEARRLALVVGENDPGGLKALAYAEADAAAVAELLRDPAAAFDEVHTLGLPSAPAATRENVLHTLDELVRATLPGDVLLVYFAGHGVVVRDVTGAWAHVLAPEDYAPDDPLGRGLRVDALLARIDLALASHRILILDACAARETIDSLSRQGSTPPVPTSRSTTLMLSAGADFVAEERADLGHGVYTSHLLHGASTRAADADHNGAVTVFEAHRYAVLGTLQDTRQTQQPSFRLDASGEIDVVLVGAAAQDPNRAVLTTLDPAGLRGWWLRLSPATARSATVAEGPPAAGVAADPGRVHVELEHARRPGYRGTFSLSSGTHLVERLVLPPVRSANLLFVSALVGGAAALSGPIGPILPELGGGVEIGWSGHLSVPAALSLTARGAGGRSPDPAHPSAGWLELAAAPMVYAGRRGWAVEAGPSLALRLLFGGYHTDRPGWTPGFGGTVRGWLGRSPALTPSLSVHASPLGPAPDDRTWSLTWSFSLGLAWPVAPRSRDARPAQRAAPRRG
jgi:hypothetical protein